MIRIPQRGDYKNTYFVLRVFPRLAHLQKLILNDCPLTEIAIPAASEDQECHFPALEMLSIVNTKLSDWMSMSALDNLPKLKILIMMGCRSDHFQNLILTSKSKLVR